MLVGDMVCHITNTVVLLIACAVTDTPPVIMVQIRINVMQSHNKRSI